MLEYALILVLVSILAIAALTNLGERITQMFLSINSLLQSL